MKKCLSKYLVPICVIFVSLLMVFLMNISYMSGRIGLNNYYLFVIYQRAGFFEFLISMFAFLHLVALFVLLTVAIFDILIKSERVEVKNKNFDIKKLEKILLTVVASISLLLLILIIIFCAVNKVYIGVGAILNTVLEILACVLFWIMDANNVFEQISSDLLQERPKKPSKQENVEQIEDAEQKDGLNDTEYTEQVEKDVETPTEADLKD